MVNLLAKSAALRCVVRPLALAMFVLGASGKVDAATVTVEVAPQKSFSFRPNPVFIQPGDTVRSRPVPARGRHDGRSTAGVRRGRGQRGGRTRGAGGWHVRVRVRRGSHPGASSGRAGHDDFRRHAGVTRPGGRARLSSAGIQMPRTNRSGAFVKCAYSPKTPSSTRRFSVTSQPCCGLADASAANSARILVP